MIVLVVGGAASGKSAYAERLTCSLAGKGGPAARLVYLAAMSPFGEEGARRVARHRAQRRGLGFATVECADGLAKAAQAMPSGACCTALLEDVGNVAANALFAADGAARPFPQAYGEVSRGLAGIAAACGNLVVVGNEVGCDGVRYEGQTQGYVRLLGRVQCELAAQADAVVECCAGVPRPLKGRDALAVEVLP